MTIQDIAKLADVSVSTVSKVLNGKDGSISQETRERIKKIAYENNYKPYAEALSGRATKLLGVLFGAGASFSMLAGMTSTAQQAQYSIVVSTCESPLDEQKRAESLIAHNVDGVVFVPGPSSQLKTYTYLASQDTPFHILDEYGIIPEGRFYSFETLGFKAAQYFVDLGHKKLCCVASSDNPKLTPFSRGVRECLFQKGIYAGLEEIQATNESCSPSWIQSCTGVMCLDSRSMAKIANLIDHLNLHITRDLSVLSFCQEEWTLDSKHISKASLPYEELGRFEISRLIHKLEHKEFNEKFDSKISIDNQSSLAPPKDSAQQKFVVVGMANMDTLISVDKQLEPGETVAVKHRMITPGGKGLNQSLGIVKLGESASLIASLGSDLDGREMFECLKAHKVNTAGVSMHEDAPSGHAYIYVQADAESSISVYGGANEHLTVSQIDENEAIFAEATCCLLQTEVSQPVILQAARMAKRHGLLVILKPCTISRIDANLLQCVDILVPNQKEAQKLVPQCQSVEEQADYFYRKGIRTVIITLADRGCYKRDKNGGVYFPAIPISPVDATGAADSFVATLAVYLSKGKSMDESIKYATCAAGLSTTRHGVPPSLVDMDTLETFYAIHHSELQERKV